jgi:hypothetical protein
MGQMGQTRQIAAGSAHLDHQVLAFDVSQIAKPLEDRLEIGVVLTSRFYLEEDSNPPEAARRWGSRLGLGHEWCGEHTQPYRTEEDSPVHAHCVAAHSR